MRENDCYFCDVLVGRVDREIIISNKLFFVIYDKFPVNKGHMLIIPKIHKQGWFDLNKSERNGLFSFFEKVKYHLDQEFNPDGYNIKINCGVTAGQTVPHLHIHMIPRYKGDVENPRGGIRNFKKALVVI